MKSMNCVTRMLLPATVALSFACTGLITAGPESATDYAQQEKDLRAALDRAQTSQGEDAEATLRAMVELSQCLELTSKLSEAETLLRAVIERKRKSTPDDSLDMAGPYNDLGSLLL